MSAFRADSDLRADRAALALDAERSNRPTYLVVVAALLLVIAVVVFVSSFFAKRSAEQDLIRRRAEAQRVMELCQRIKGLRIAAAEAKKLDVGQARGDIALEIKKAAPGALAPALPVPQEQTRDKDQERRVQQRVWIYQNIRSESLADLLTWAQNAPSKVSGLEVRSVQLKPESNVWNMRVEFARWEKMPEEGRGR